MNYKIVIIGGGPAGMAAAVSAKESGVDSVLVIERDHELGGILNQCIHNGFGLHRFKEELTGPEYAQRYINMVKEKDIDFMLDTIVLSVSEDKKITCMNKDRGIFDIDAEAVILAMGCRERPRGAINTPGYRPAGIYSAGTAQKLINMDGYMPGKEVVIIGSGDIGLIMARRMVLEGADVKLVAEIMPYSGGLKRNIVQCLDDYDIPLKLSHTVTDIRGKDRVESVVVQEVDENLKPIPGTEEEVECDTVLLSVGLIPENEISRDLGIEINPATSGASVGDSLMTNVDGVFSCGNVLHVHDLVDYVSEEAALAGKNAALYVQGRLETSDDKIPVKTGEGVTYTVPVRIDKETMPHHATVRFRVDQIYEGKRVKVLADGEEIYNRKRRVMAPGEMEQLVINKEDIEQMDPEELVIEVGE